MSDSRGRIVIDGVPEKTIQELEHIKSINGITRNTFIKSKLPKIIEDFYEEHPSKKPI